MRLVVAGLTLIINAWLPPAARAASVATLDCSTAANGTGNVGVYLPAPGVATYDHVSRFWVKYDGVYASYDWRQEGGWRFGDSQTSFVYDESTGQWSQLPANTWAIWDSWNSGTVHVWEEQYYWESQSWQGHALGSCVVWQFFIFNPSV